MLKQIESHNLVPTFIMKRADQLDEENENVPEGGKRLKDLKVRKVSLVDIGAVEGSYWRVVKDLQGEGGLLKRASTLIMGLESLQKDGDGIMSEQLQTEISSMKLLLTDLGDKLGNIDQTKFVDADSFNAFQEEITVKIDALTPSPAPAPKVPDEKDGDGDDDNDNDDAVGGVDVDVDEVVQDALSLAEEAKELYDNGDITFDQLAELNAEVVEPALNLIGE